MSSTYQSISLTFDDRVARITFARPPLNIFNIAMMKEICDALTECFKHDLVAIVFASDSESRAFSAGVAIEEHVAETVFQMLDSFHAIFRLLEQLSRPTIALVDGAALGGGCELVAVCDVVIATDRARFGQPEVKLAVFPPVAAIFLPRIIGEKRARELILTGEVIDASTALELGLCNHVVPETQLEQKATEVLTKLRELSAVGVGYARHALDLGIGHTLDTALRQQENLYLHELMKSVDANEGVKAFIEKRKPVWRDR